MDLLNILILLLAIFFFFISWTYFLGAPWIPSSVSTVHRMLRLAEVRPGDIVYDLGSGDGRVLIAAVRYFGARAVGIEIDPIRYLITRIKINVMGLQDKAQVILANLFSEDLSNADVIVVYLSQDANMRLSKKLMRELRPGTRIVSHTFKFLCFREVKNKDESQIYLYRTRNQ